jgi:hypothetical protein
MMENIEFVKLKDTKIKNNFHNFEFQNFERR